MKQLQSTEGKTKSRAKKGISSFDLSSVRQGIKFAKLLRISLIALAVLGVIVFLLWGGIPKTEQAIRMHSYLHNKYGGYYIIHNVQVVGAGFGIGPGYFVAEAFPVGKPRMTFTIAEDKETYEDDYHAAVWAEGEYAPMEALLKKEGKDLKSLKIRLIPTRELSKKLGSQVPSFNKLPEADKRVVSYDLRLTAKGVRPINEDDEVDFITEVTNYMESRGCLYEHVSIQYRVVDERGTLIMEQSGSGDLWKKDREYIKKWTRTY